MANIDYGMSKVRTTVYLEGAEYQRLKRLADAEGRSAAELIRAAVARFLEEAHETGQPDWIGSMASGDADWAEDAPERLDGFGQS